MAATEPETVSWIRILVACGIVGGLLAALGYGLKFLNKHGIAWSANGFGTAKRDEKKRLAIVESLPLDLKRRLLIVRCDKQEHLLLLGVNQDTLVATNIDSRSPNSASQPPEAP
ncbi:MAG: flagellar biosynthetic protein FliO [Bdellovibrionales bacterium]